MTVRIGKIDRQHRARLRDIVTATESFRDDEVDVAVELFDASFSGDDYEFVGAFGENGALDGYACFGPTPSTDRTWDLYWIVVHPEAQGSGSGSQLLQEVERQLSDRNARLLVVETSGGTAYHQTRRFYMSRSYREQVRLRDFYAPGDDRVIYTKRLNQQ